MVMLLTASLVVLGLGLTLLLLSFRRAPAKATATPESPEAATPPKRSGIRPIPLVLGLLLAISGGIAAFVIWSNPERADQWVLENWPADSLVNDLDHDDAFRRSDAHHELQRRYEAGELSPAVQRRLAARHIAAITRDTESPEAPRPNAPVVQVDLAKARIDNILETKAWGEYVARTTPLRLDVPRRADVDKPLEMQFTLSLADHQAPAWVIVRLEELTVGGKPIADTPAVAVAPNADWEEPAPREAREPDPDGPPAAAGSPPHVIRRVVRYPVTIPAEMVAELGEGTHEVKGKIRVWAFDREELAPPSDLLSDAATGTPRNRPATYDQAAVLSGPLTPEQVEQLTADAQGTWEWPVDSRVEVGPPGSAAAPPRRPGGQQQGGGGGDGAGGDGAGGDAGSDGAGGDGAGGDGDGDGDGR